MTSKNLWSDGTALAAPLQRVLGVEVTATGGDLSRPA
jgi:hypothetical protein